MNSVFSFSVYIDTIYYYFFFFFFNDTATTEIYTLSLHDALPISPIATYSAGSFPKSIAVEPAGKFVYVVNGDGVRGRSEEHTSELQSQSNLVCRLLLEKKKMPDVCSQMYGHPTRNVNRTM